MCRFSQFRMKLVIVALAQSLNAALVLAQISAPNPLSPSGAIDDKTPDFAWSSVEGADHYEIVVNDLTADKLAVAGDANVTATTWTSSVTLKNDRSYQWIVRAVDAAGTSGPWSSRWTFGVDTDTDDDGLDDDWEILHFGDMNSSGEDDGDGDGASNSSEYQHDANPNDPDTDADGVSDGDEIANGYDPVVETIIHHVDAARPDDSGDGTSPATAKKTIQASVDLAKINDGRQHVVLVAAGVYDEVGDRDIDLGGYEMIVRSVEGPEATIIDCGDAGRAFRIHSGEDDQSMIRGFTIRNGSQTYGGGIYLANSSPVFKNCVIENNQTSAHGGGIYVYGGAPLFVECVVSGNSASGQGGGAYINSADLRFRRCLIINNQALGHDGGAVMALAGRLEMSDCDIWYNYAHYNGGAIHARYGVEILLNRCDLFAGWSAAQGGGLCAINAGETTLVNCMLSYNFCDGWGGALRNRDGVGSFNLINCTLFENWSKYGGWAVSGSSGSTLDLNMVNSIVMGSVIVDEGVVNVSHSLVPQEITDLGAGNFTDDPLFTPAGWLTPNSPCVDAGTSDSAPGDDFHKQDRPAGGGFDVGCDEFVDSDGDGIPDWMENAAGTDMTAETDQDGDGAGDLAEYLAGTDPFSADTDGDGVSDGDEFVNGYDPLIETIIYYVDASRPDDSGDGTSPATAKKTLQAGVDLANVDDGREHVVLAAPGTYSGSGNLDVSFGGYGVKLRSSSGAETTIIDCAGAGRAFRLDDGETNEAWIDGFTIRDGAADYGGAVYLASSSPTIKNCKFEYNNASVRGGAIYGYNASPTINDCVFDSNVTAGQGGAAYLNGGASSLDDCIFLLNEAHGHDGGALYLINGSTTLEKCDLWGNYAHYNGGGICVASAATGTMRECEFFCNWSGAQGGAVCAINANAVSLENCMIANNVCSGWGGALRNRVGSAAWAITNCTLIDNWSNYGGSDLCGDGEFSIDMRNSVVTGSLNVSSATVAISHSRVPAGYETLGEGNFTDDPGLTPAGWLRANSICVDAGTAIGAPSIDFHGQNRPAGGGFDVGCDEFVDSDGDGIPDWLETLVDGDLTADGDQDSDGANNLQEFLAGTNPLDSDSDGDGITDGDEIVNGYDPLIETLVHHVDATRPDDSGDGTSPPTAKKTIQAGVDLGMIPDGREHVVLVAAGTYSGTGNVEVSFGGNDIILKSSSGAETTIIDCDGAGRALHLSAGETSVARIEGFTVRNGASSQGSAIRASGASPTIKNCRFEQNIASGNGGAIYGYDASLTVIGCQFDQNIASALGGAAYLNGGSSTFRDCVIASNEAHGHDGGGLYLINGSTTIEKCDVSGNYAHYNGGGICVASAATATLRECEIASDWSEAQGGAVCAINANAVSLENCLVADNACSGWGGSLRNRAGSASWSITNCTLIDNECNYGGSDLCGDGAFSIDMRNSVVTGSLNVSTATVAITHSRVPVGYEPLGEGNFTDDPGLTLAGWLTSGSPCVDAGTAIGAPTIDIRGQSRPAGLGVDVGCDEFIDSDGDGVPDWFEDLYGPMTANGDNDNDGVSNLDEYLQGTDPGIMTMIDEDGDGLDDEWEMDHFGNLDQGAHDDDDEDGFDNLVEYQFGLDPNQAESRGDDDGDGYANVFELAHGADPDNPSSIPAPTLFVSLEGGDDGDGSQANPFNNIHDALAESTDFDVIQVAPGVYKGAKNTSLTIEAQNVMLVSESGSAQTIIDCQKNRGLFIRECPGFVALMGFTIKNSNYLAIYFYKSEAAVINCAFHDNYYSNGAAFYMYEAEAVFHNCAFIGNRSDNNGAVGYVNRSYAALRDCVFHKNRCANSDGVMFYGYEGDIDIINSIVWDNSPNALGENVSISHSSVQGGYPGEGNVDSDPLITADGRLRSGSPCVDAGIQDTALTFDIDGEPRDDAPDTGADEFVDSDGDGLGDAWESLWFGDLDHDGDGDVDGDGLNELQEYVNACDPTKSDTDGDGLSDSQELDVYGTSPTLADTDHDGLNDGWEVAEGLDPLAYNPEGMNDQDHDGYPDAFEAFHGADHDDPNSIPEPTLFISLDFNEDTPGFGETKFNNFKAAINGSVGFDIIQVAPGVYSGNDNKNAFIYNKRLMIFSESGPESTILEGENAGSYAMSINNQPSIIRGFTFIRSGERALNIYGSDSRIENCVFRNNYGISPVYISNANPIIRNCVFRENNVTSYGGGAYCYGDAEFINCSFFGNVTSGNGGAVYVANDCNVNIVNGIFWNNSPNQVEGSATISHSCVQGGFEGEGNIDADPLLSQSGYLTNNSPCVDAGVDNPSRLTDINGQAPWDHPNHDNVVSIVDMGAREFVDSDSDGLSDAWEIVFFNNLTHDGTGDADNDGITDAEEYSLGLNPVNDDTDGDGLTDGDEINIYETVPDNADSDNDDMDDGWEIDNGLDPLSSIDAFGDVDNDGYLNVFECVQGMNAADPLSTPEPTMFVADNASDGDGTIDNPYNSLATAVTRCGPYEIIKIDPGIYDCPSGVYCNKKKFMILSESEPADTILDFANNNGNGFYGNGADDLLVMNGVTVKNCQDYAVYMANVVMRNCVMEKNKYCAIKCTKGICSLTNCALKDNSSNESVIYCSQTSSKFTSCLFQNNAANSSYSYGPISLYNGQSVFINCLILGNSSNNNEGVIYNCAGTLDMVNCTLLDNQASSSNGGIYSCSGAVTNLTNCVLWGNTADQIHGETNVTYSCVQGGYDGEGNIDVDPKVTISGFLMNDSPCVDAGANVDAPEFDVHGESRWDHPDIPNACSIVDIGADEFVDFDADTLPDAWEKESFGDLSHAAAADDDGDGLTNLEEFELGTKANVADTDGDGLTDGEEVNSHNTNPLDTDTDDDGMGDGQEIAHGLNPLSDEDAFEDPDNDGYMNVYEFIHGSDLNDPDSKPTPNKYVSLSGSPSGDGSSQNPFDSIKTAVQNASSYDIIQVAPGTYAGSDNRDVYLSGDIKIMLISENGPEETIIDCESSGRALSIQSTAHALVVKGFTMRNSNNNNLLSCYNANARIVNCVFEESPSTAVYVSYGAPTFSSCVFRQNVSAVYCGSTDAIFENCLFTDNVASNYGGAVRASSGSPSFNNCEFTGNTAGSYGGAIYAYNGSPSFQNCVFKDNSASYYGGAIYLHSATALLVNCNILNNAVNNSGGGLYAYSSSDTNLTNCVLWGNTPDQINGSVVVAYSCVQDGYLGLCNIDIDPRLSLLGFPRSDSPCIDAGMDEGSPVLDLAGQARWDHPGVSNVQSEVDIGAYEFVDTDTDGMCDYLEIKYFGVLSYDMSLDSDNDGLPDFEELLSGTDLSDSDSDDDGLADGEEVNDYMTNPLKSDTDHDGMPDKWEVDNSLNPLVDDSASDADADGLSNLLEFQNDADPNNSDTDNDGLPDAWEFAFGLDLNHNDSSEDLDGDGLSNLMEYQNGSNPSLSDSDGDGLSDSDEVNLHSTDPTNADSDGDGTNDYDESILGTNPNDSSSGGLPVASLIGEFSGVYKWNGNVIYENYPIASISSGAEANDYVCQLFPGAPGRGGDEEVVPPHDFTFTAQQESVTFHVEADYYPDNPTVYQVTISRESNSIRIAYDQQTVGGARTGYSEISHIDIDCDSNNDGSICLNDELFEQFSTGLLIPLNNDNDDFDSEPEDQKEVDNQNTKIDGENDELDMRRIVIRKYDNPASADTVVKLKKTGGTGSVRIFFDDGEDGELILGPDDSASQNLYDRIKDEDLNLLVEGVETGLVKLKVESQVSGSTLSYDEVYVTVIGVKMATDLNRDMLIDFDDVNDQTTSDKPYRFWVNNDRDVVGEYVEEDAQAYPQNGDPGDSGDCVISCKRDLEDFSMLRLRIDGIPKEDLVSGEYVCHLRVDGPLGTTLSTTDFNVYEFPNGSMDYLTDEDIADDVVDNSGARYLPNSDYYGEIIIPGEMFDNDAVEANFLFESKEAGEGIWTVKLFHNDSLILEYPAVHMEIRDIKDMYERYYVGDIAGESWQDINDISPNDIPNNYNKPEGTFSYTDDGPEDKDYILFVHGWRMQPWEKVYFAETAFKRLFWQGYNGRFGAFMWPTEWVNADSYYEMCLDHNNYNDSEWKAFVSGAALHKLLLCLDLRYPDKVRVFAHSMGNVVTSEALRIESEYKWPPKISERPVRQIAHTYVASQAAMVAHAYDSNVPDMPAGVYNNRYTPNVYIAYPQVESPQPISVYFNDIKDVVVEGNIINFFNEEDAALSIWKLNQRLKPMTEFGYGYDAGFEEYFHDPIGSPCETLTLIDDHYEIFSQISESYSASLGATNGVGNVIVRNLNLDSSDFDYGAERSGHSLQFYESNMEGNLYWKKLLENFKITTD